MPGVFLHANYIEAMNRGGGTLSDVPEWIVRVTEVVLAIVLALIGTAEIHAAWKWLIALACFSSSVAITYFILQTFGFFMDFLIPLIMLVGHSVVEGALGWRLELHELKHKHREVEGETKAD